MPDATKTPEPSKKTAKLQELDEITIRFAGDSGDGIQLTGMQFTRTTAIAGNDLSTLPDYPAEIRAPAGTLPGISGFQIHFGGGDILTPGDAPDVLVAMNPAALKGNLKDLKPGGFLIVNTDSFTPQNLAKAAYAADPLKDGSLSGYRVLKVELSRLTGLALQGLDLTKVQAERSKNFFALGMMYWLFDRPLDPTLRWIEEKFKKSPVLVEANKRALKAGNAYAETTEIFNSHYTVKKAALAPGIYRNITGNEATALGMVAASVLSGIDLWYGSYPITPASDVLHELSKHKNFGVRTFQAEDEIAAIGSAIGASFGGKLGATGTSGPGLALKSEAIGYAVMLELPLVILDVQRSGPSTGMPTKTEQADLLQALYGRHGECPAPVLAAATPADCFGMVIEAFRIAVKYMTPVVFLSDGYLANGSEPWRIPGMGELPRFSRPPIPSADRFKPYARDSETLARPWVSPGNAGYEHRIGGIEKADITGNVSYDPDNHERMTRLRAAKVAQVAREIPQSQIQGASSGKLLVIGWGSTYGSITQAVRRSQAKGLSVSSLHLRFLNPLPPDLGEIIGRFERVLVPEINLGQLVKMIRSRYLVDAKGFNCVRGQPLKASDVEEAIEDALHQGGARA